MWAIAETVPPEWYGGDTSELEMLVEKLLERKMHVREHIEMFRESSRNPFPKWVGMEEKGVEGVVEAGKMVQDEIEPRWKM